MNLKFSKKEVPCTTTKKNPQSLLFILMLFTLMLKVDIGWGQATCGSINPSMNTRLEIHGSGDKTVNVNWVRVLDSNCQGEVDIELTNQIINSVENIFRGYGITLNRISCQREMHKINKVCNSTYYAGDGVTTPCLFSDICNPNTLNVFLLPESANLDGYLGLAILPGNLCVAKASSMERVRTIVHEIGHCFGLYHTCGTRDPWNWGTNNHWTCHSTITGAPQENFSCDGNSYFSFIEFEKVNGSNSSTSGDFVVDTPADIAMGGLNGCSPNSDCLASADCQENLNIARTKDPNCQKYVLPYRNFMRHVTNQCVTEFTSGQVSRMKGVLSQFLGAIQTDTCDLCPDLIPDFCSPCHEGHEHLTASTITGSFNISQPTLITKNLTINGGTLNVNSDLYIAPDKYIYIHNGGTLNVELNGHITSCSAEAWNGVYQINGSVNINNGKISKAVYGILSTSNSNTINCNNADFFECTQSGVTIFGNATSSFINTAFFGMNYGAVIVGSVNNTSFQNCTFAYQAEAGIAAFNGSSISVSNNNQFTGCTHAISLNNIFGTNSWNEIGNSTTAANQFINCYNGVYSVNSRSEILNNYFNNNNYGLVLRGLNKFESHSNTFTGASCAEAIDGTGSNSNQSFGNQYSSEVGIFPHNDNAGYNFYNNCFSTMWWDVNALGIINEAQFGPNDKAAGNCFTHGGVTDFICETLGSPVTYGIPSSPNSPNCLFPNNTGNWNYTTELKDFIATGDCGAGFVSQNQYLYLIAMGCNEQKLKKSIDSLKLVVKSLKVATQTPIIRYLLAKAERHLRFAISQWAWCLRKDERFIELKEWFKSLALEFPDDKYFALEMASTTVTMRQYSLAKSEIDSIAFVHNLFPDIVTAIKMSVDVQQADDIRYLNFNNIESTEEVLGGILSHHFSSYVLSSEGHQLLYRVSLMTEPEAAFGRALLTYLTGEIIDNLSVSLSPRSRPSLDAKKPTEIYKINPNPADQDVILEIEYQDFESEYTYSMMNINGQIVAQGQIKGVTTINISSLVNGIYIVHISKNNLPVEVRKFVKQ